MAEVNAGRVMILPLGNYNSATPYHVLDLVYYNGSSWLCRQECTGVTPTDSATAYWQKFGAAVSVATITTAGIVRPDGATVLVAADGTISIPVAELNKLGIVKPDGTTIVVDANGTLSARVAGALSALTDVNISQATQGQILQYDVTTQKWKNVSKTWLTELEQMEDVDIDTSTLANGQALIYNATSGKWGNAAISQYPKLDTVEQVMANTQSGKVADALTIKEINTNLTQQLTASDGVPFRFGKDSSGNYGYILNQGGADTVIPFKKGGLGDAEDILMMGGQTSIMIALNKEGNSHYHSSGTRNDIVNRLNNGECSFISGASAVSGTSYIMMVTLSKTGYYAIGYENNFTQGRIALMNSGENHNVSCDFNFICYFGDTDPFA